MFGISPRVKVCVLVPSIVPGKLASEASDANSPGVKVGTKGAAIQDYNLPGNTIIGPVKIDSGWGFGHWQSWADADNIATTTSNAEKAFTNLGIMQPSLYLNYVVKV